MDQIRERAPAALAALDRLLAVDDQAAIKIIMERVAPKVLVEDQEVGKAIGALRAEIDKQRTEIERLQGENETLRDELKFARAVIDEMTPAAGKMPPADGSGDGPQLPA